MKFAFLHIYFLGLLACAGSNTDIPVTEQDQTNENISNEFEPKEGGELYVNEFGEIELVNVDDTTVRTIFRNNNGDEWDTLMRVINDFELIETSDSMPFLTLGMRGIQKYKHKIQVFEFSSMLFIDQFIRIEHLYDRPFFKSGTNVFFDGDVENGKGATIDGIWLLNAEVPSYNATYLQVEGTIRKEEFPKDYYSTDESPQGMFGEESGPHYRLVIENASISTPEPSIYGGYPVILASGEPAIAWEFADSEAYILEGHEPWNRHDLSKRYKVSGYLVQNETGSYLKNWRIIK